MELDEALRGAREGEEEGFLVLWRTYQPRLLRYLRVYAGRDVEDLASETWLQVVRDLHGYRGSADSFVAWLFSIARRRAVDAHRAQGRRPSVPLDLREELLPRGYDAPAAEQLVMDQLSTQQALALIASLPPDQADAVALSVVVGLDAATIGEVVGASAGTVRVRLHRGLRRLETLLAREREQARHEEGVTA
jgi:RNA polymerase sigma-70 factor (ECF subfamily)